MTRVRPSFLPTVAVGLWVLLPLEGQIQGEQQSFYAEQRQETWYQDGRRVEDVVRITRLANRSFLALYPLTTSKDPTRHTGGHYFYLNDTETQVQYDGDTDLGAAWPQYLETDSSLRGKDPMVDRYGDCSVLSDDSVRKVDAGKVLGYAVLRIDTVDGAERYANWIAPELGCFPLRSQVLVDEFVRLRVDTIHVELLPADTRLSIPRGVRIISPQAYCDLYRKRYRHEYLPQRLCSKYQGLYEEARGVKGEPRNPAKKP